LPHRRRCCARPRCDCRYDPHDEYTAFGSVAGRRSVLHLHQSDESQRHAHCVVREYMDKNSLASRRRKYRDRQSGIEQLKKLGAEVSTPRRRASSRKRFAATMLNFTTRRSPKNIPTFPRGRRRQAHQRPRRDSARDGMDRRSRRKTSRARPRPGASRG